MDLTNSFVVTTMGKDRVIITRNGVNVIMDFAKADPNGDYQPTISHGVAIITKAK